MSFAAMMSDCLTTSLQVPVSLLSRAEGDAGHDEADHRDASQDGGFRSLPRQPRRCP